MKYLQKYSFKFIFLSGIFASIACLFHQIHFFWWLALLFGVFLQAKHQKLKKTLIFVIPALLVPLVYSFVLYYYNQKSLTFDNFFKFVFEYYYSVNADVKIDKLNFILTPISLFRSFFQIHGNIINFFAAHTIVYVLGILVFIFCIGKFLFPWNFKFNLTKDTFINVHITAFFLQLFFAFYSKGNAEFMVMLPFFIAIILSKLLLISNKKLMNLSAAMLIWNIGFAILPNNFYDFQNNEKLIEIIKANPDKKFILEECHKIATQYLYLYGQDISDRLFCKEIIIKNRQTGTFYTDVLNKSKPYGRASIVSKSDKEFQYSFVKNIAGINAFYGNYTIDEINLK